MKQQTRSILIAFIVLLAIGQAVFQRMLDPQIREIHKGEKTALAGLSNEFILGPMLGLQQAVAGALWVRADEFFHEGDYDAILPIVRMVTWLDPHQLDVYITGAWHLSYNFTDSNERSDRRYIPAAQRLLEEGYENNKTLYDIPFELGWENTDKIKDYDRAEYWFRLATGAKSADAGPGTLLPAPMFTWHQLAHSLERQGRIDESADVWRKVLAMSEEKVSKNPNDYSTHNVRDSERHNLELLLKRKFSRYTHQMDFEIDQKLTKSVNLQTGEPSPNQSYISTDPKMGPVGQPRPPATAVPWNTAFETISGPKTTIVFDKPKELDAKGVFNVGDGARVAVRLHDADWYEPTLKDFSFDIDQSQTIMQDALSVRQKMWGRKIDMSRDPKMYSFSKDAMNDPKNKNQSVEERKKIADYYLVLWFDCRGTSPFIQDKFGWSGEGMTDPKYLYTVKSNKPGIKPDNRILRKVYKLRHAQIMSNEPVTEADVIPNDEYEKIQADLAKQKHVEKANPEE
jgi:hypothetical protein